MDKQNRNRYNVNELSKFCNCRLVVNMRSMVGISCTVENETKQTKCAKTFQTVWLLPDRGRGAHIGGERKRNKQKTKVCGTWEAEVDNALQ